MEQIINKHVGLALSKESSHQKGPTDEMSLTAKGKSSVALTEHTPTATEVAAIAFEPPNPGALENRPHWPMDDITMRSTCDLLDVCRNEKLVVAHGTVSLRKL
jgi:hypothetical protein